MILTEVKLWDFRKFKSLDNGEPGLTAHFHEGLNALVGENDSGKSSIIDAIKFVLWTQSGEYIRISEDDFHLSTDGKRASQVKIELRFDSFNENEAKNFIELLSIEKNENEEPNFYLKLYFRARREGSRIFTDLRAGNPENGPLLEGRMRELLKAVYLRPLRDADREMSSGRNSRISQILMNHPKLEGRKDELVEIFKEANKKIDSFFKEDSDGGVIVHELKKTIQEFFEYGIEASPEFKIAEIEFKSILESLSLNITDTHPGLGALNLIFIAAELLLLSTDDNGALRLALIEEMEAHLHPQAQIRLISYMQSVFNKSGAQIIISTHSPILASEVNIKNIILLKDSQAYDLIPEKTKLETSDYLFLQRFLTSTRANMFFAKGIIMVEGDAENLIIPALADILDLNLEKHGVSVVNIGHIGFFRYSRIFLRADGSAVNIPISIVTDCDVQVEKDQNGEIDIKGADTEEAIDAIKEKYDDLSIKAFVAPHWTLEYTILLSCLKDLQMESILLAKKINEKMPNPLKEDSSKDISSELEEITSSWSNMEEHEIAFGIFNENFKGGNPVSKGVAAQCFASLLRWSILMETNEKSSSKDKMFDIDLYQMEIDTDKKEHLKSRIKNDQYFKYLVDAIEYATIGHRIKR